MYTQTKLISFQALIHMHAALFQLQRISLHLPIRFLHGRRAKHFRTARRSSRRRVDAREQLRRYHTSPHLLGDSEGRTSSLRNSEAACSGCSGLAFIHRSSAAQSPPTGSAVIVCDRASARGSLHAHGAPLLYSCAGRGVHTSIVVLHSDGVVEVRASGRGGGSGGGGHKHPVTLDLRLLHGLRYFHRSPKWRCLKAWVLHLCQSNSKL